MTAAAALLALAAHFAGDFPLQTDEMAARKFDDPSVRLEHCLTYTVAFFPVAIAAGWSLTRGAGFLGLIFGSHFIIDSRRWVEPTEEFPTFPIWYDQALHIIALGVAFALVQGVVA